MVKATVTTPPVVEATVTTPPAVAWDRKRGKRDMGRGARQVVTAMILPKVAGMAVRTPAVDIVDRIPVVDTVRRTPAAGMADKVVDVGNRIPAEAMGDRTQAVVMADKVADKVADMGDRTQAVDMVAGVGTTTRSLHNRMPWCD